MKSATGAMFNPQSLRTGTSNRCRFWGFFFWLHRRESFELTSSPESCRTEEDLTCLSVGESRVSEHTCSSDAFPLPEQPSLGKYLPIQVGTHEDGPDKGHFTTYTSALNTTLILLD